MKYLANIFFVMPLILIGFQINWQGNFFTLPVFQSECIKQVVGDSEIIIDQPIDVDQNGEIDQVILYGKDDVYVAVILNQPSESCEVILNEYLTALKLVNPTTWRTVQVQQIEMIELTGDNQPELHIWLEKTGAPSRYEHAIHAIYTFGNGHLQKALSTEQCLAFSSFEFRNGNEQAKDIYLDTDGDCQPPWSYQRTYNIMGWDGAKFTPKESGTIDVFTASPSWFNVFCVAILVIPVVGLVLVILRVITNKKSA